YLTDYASKHHIRIMWASFSPITPPGSNFEHRSVVMNSNWHNPKEFIFQLAHEISHVIHGDKGDVFYYHACYTGKESVEYKANVGAVKLLVPFFCRELDKPYANPHRFMSAFSVPSYLADVVTEEIKKYYAE
ncbi:ImmA/IrrE family metallo-endopeptidase, partial [Limosilactobacillus vaginalis]|uniref:ImmA/IrrE family metallo-endopeptidase n=1 Tax=Limosilactobacillus vaginalis TaxID=1633 RepID=UPI00360DDEA5